MHVSQSWFSPGVMILPILAGALLLWPRALLILFGVVAVTLAYDVFHGKVGPGIITTIVVTAAFAFVLARTRAKLGIQGLRGDQMLIELRDRIRDQGRLPRLPGGWQAASVLQPASGSSFGGDFVVSAFDGKTLQVGAGGRVRQGDRRGHQGAAALRRVRRAAGLGAGRRLPQRLQRLPAAPPATRRPAGRGPGRGFRHRRAPVGRPGDG